MDKSELIFEELSNLPRIYWDELNSKDPFEQAQFAGVSFEPDLGFTVKFLGANYIVKPAQRTILGPSEHRPICFQKGLVLLMYLRKMTGNVLNSEMVPPRELKSGDFFFRSPHEVRTEPLTEYFKNNSSALLKKAKFLGATILEQKEGQGSIWWPILPKIALGLVFYESDDEFSASAIYTINSNADDYFALDTIFALLNLATDELIYNI